MSRKQNSIRMLLPKLRRLFKREPELPEDLYSYVSAPKKPRLPGCSAAAVADPEE